MTDATIYTTSSQNQLKSPQKYVTQGEISIHVLFKLTHCRLHFRRNERFLTNTLAK